MRQCTNCQEIKVESHFGSKSWTNKDGSKTFTRKSWCRPCVNKSNLLRYHTSNKTKLAHRRASYKYRIKLYGLSVEDYENLLKESGGVCAICKNKPEKRLHIDHCHNTGKIRKLLCITCNSGLGMFKDDVNLLAKAIKYLEDHS